MTEVITHDPLKATEESAVMHLMNQMKDQSEYTDQPSFGHVLEKMQMLQ